MIRASYSVIWLGALCIAVGAGCHSGDGGPGPCGNHQIESVEGVVISGKTMHRIITSPPADKDCPADLDIIYRYNDEVLAREGRPDNVSVVFIVEGDGALPDTLSLPDPVATEVSTLKFWEVTVTHTARLRPREPVYYIIDVGSNTVELPEIMIEAAVEYMPHGLR
jgi:hypothetical protein